MCVTEDSVVGRDHDIAAQDQFQSAGERQPVDRRDRRQPRCFDPREHTAQLAEEMRETGADRGIAGTDRPQVGTRAEGASDPADDERAHRRIGFGRFDSGLKVVRQPEREAV